MKLKINRAKLILRSLKVKTYFTSLIIDGWFSRVPNSINASFSPAVPNVHYNSGFRRMARINGTTVALAPSGSNDRVYRSTNNGDSWSEIDTDGTYSGSLISGKDQYLYHFYINRGTGIIYMVKFLYNATPPTPVAIYSNSALQSSSVLSEYCMLNANVNSLGHLYVATHWGSSDDHIYVFKSVDEGSNWTGPVQISDTNGDFHYCNIEVDASDNLFCSWRDETNDDIRFSRSTDGGATWSASVSHAASWPDTYSNPTILTRGSGNVYMFIQRDNSLDSSLKGVFVKKSTNSGSSWSVYYKVDSTCSYGDPGAGLGSDMTLYCAIRSNNGSGLTNGDCGEQCKSRMLKSTDDGVTWTPVDNYYAGERTGTRNQIRYQTWWNYGGPLEWMWLQNTNGMTQIPVYYDINTQVSIYDIQNP